MTFRARTTTLFASLAALLFIAACQDGTAPPTMWSAQPYGDEELPFQDRDDDALMPADHTVDWMRRHGSMALGQGNDCAVCHLEDDCITCHVESLANPYAVHPPNYTVVHASDARMGLQDCTSCHRLDTFCQACHVETGNTPRLEDGLPAGVDFHPPGWLDSGMPNNHGVMARRDINDCASCHVEQDCVSCHIGINPHPPEFRFECRQWLETNPTPCAQCHVEVNQLRDLCF